MGQKGVLQRAERPTSGQASRKVRKQAILHGLKPAPGLTTYDTGSNHGCVMEKSRGRGSFACVKGVKLVCCGIFHNTLYVLRLFKAP